MIYCLNRPESIELLQSMQENPEFTNFISKLDNVNIEEILMSPIQKICKYPLVLHSFRKTYVKADGAVALNLSNACRDIGKVAEAIRDIKNKIENAPNESENAPDESKVEIEGPKKEISVRI